MKECCGTHVQYGCTLMLLNTCLMFIEKVNIDEKTYVKWKRRGHVTRERGRQREREIEETNSVTATLSIGTWDILTNPSACSTKETFLQDDLEPFQNFRLISSLLISNRNICMTIVKIAQQLYYLQWFVNLRKSEDCIFVPW